MARADATGVVVAPFAPVVQGSVKALLTLPDGRYVLGGELYRTNLAKLRSEGTLDAEFKVEVSDATGPDTALAGKLTQIRTQPDGRILIGCAWQPAAWPPGGPGRALVTRLEPDGTGDPFFRAAEPTSAWGVSVTSLALGPNDAIWLGGAFATVNGEPRLDGGGARLRPTRRALRKTDSSVAALLVRVWPFGILILAMDLGLQNKVALVTGGSRGLGRAICLTLAEEGAKVAVNYLRTDPADWVPQLTAKRGAQAVAVKPCSAGLRLGGGAESSTSPP